VAENDEGRNFPEPPEGLVKPQDDSVVALLDDPDQLEAAVAELVEQGFERDRIWVLGGTEGVERLDVDGRHHGLRGRVYRLVEWMGDEKASAARVLGAHGAHGMAHFGRDHWEPLGS